MESIQDYKAPCNRCDRQRYVITRHDTYARAKQCQACFEVCPACHGTEYTFVRDERGYRFAKRCQVCGPLKKRIDAFNTAHLPVRYHHANFGNFQTYMRKSPQKPLGEKIGNLPQVRTKIWQWAQSFAPGDRGFMLYGVPGTGKTHLLAAVIHYLTLEKGIHARFVEFTHLLSEIRHQFDHGRGDNAVLSPLMDAEVLAIDELGKGVNTDWQLSVLDELISKRYNNNKTTLFTTNFLLESESFRPMDLSSPEFSRRAERETLKERVGDRIFSRLFEMTEFVQVDAPDYRKHYAAEV